MSRVRLISGMHSSLLRTAVPIAIAVSAALALGVAAGVFLFPRPSSAPGASSAQAADATPARITGGYSGPIFAPNSGWNTVETGTVSPPPVMSPALGPRTCPSAGSLHWAGVPKNTIETLPPDGIVIVAWLPLPEVAPAPPGNVNFPDQKLPLSIESGEFFTSYETQPAQNVSLLRILSRTNEQYLQVQIYFGILSPGGELLRRAQGELNQLMIPPSDQ